MTVPWEQILEDRLQLYGHRNWLVIADSAYPAQSRLGIETIIADEKQTTVLRRVFTLLRNCKHIKPKIYVDEELGFVAESDARGVTSYREHLKNALMGYEMCTFPHEEIISMLDRVGEKFRVLLIKTKMRIPYTSVFFELECGYWNSEAENRLRIAMQSTDQKLPSSEMAEGIGG